jgi:dTDP-glucose 4,6-dehydratase
LYIDIKTKNPIKYCYLTGTKQKVIYNDLPVDDPKQRRPDITKAKEILDWTPKINREEGLKRTYAYFKKLSTAELIATEHNNFDKFILK